jgi:hypothetical protein
MTIVAVEELAFFGWQVLLLPLLEEVFVEVVQE